MDLSQPPANELDRQIRLGFGALWNWVLEDSGAHEDFYDSIRDDAWSRPAAGPDGGVVPPNDAIVPESEAPTTPAPDASPQPSGRGVPGTVLAVGGLVVLVLIAGLSGVLLGRGATPPSPAGGAGQTEATSQGPGPSVPAATSPRPAGSPAGPPPQVIIATNEFSLTPVDATFCRDGGTISFLYKLEGIAPNTPFEVTLTGPGANAELTLTASPDTLVEQSYEFPPGGGRWTSTITSIGGNPPPTSGSVASTSVDPC